MKKLTEAFDDSRRETPLMGLTLTTKKKQNLFYDLISSAVFLQLFSVHSYFIFNLFYFIILGHSLWFCNGWARWRMLKLYNRSTQQLMAEKKILDFWFQYEQEHRQSRAITSDSIWNHSEQSWLVGLYVVRCCLYALGYAHSLWNR